MDLGFILFHIMKKKYYIVKLYDLKKKYWYYKKFQ